MQSDKFALRHIGPNEEEITKMLAALEVDSLEGLLSETLPEEIRLPQQLTLREGISEYRFLNNLRALSNENKLFETYIGLGYNPTVTPAVIQRNIMENPGWYTAYTPYQAEIAQGRLEALFNFQSMVCDLTGMELANASLLDEATAAAEASASPICCRNAFNLPNAFSVSAPMIATCCVLNGSAPVEPVPILPPSHPAMSAKFFLNSFTHD